MPQITRRGPQYQVREHEDNWGAGVDPLVGVALFTLPRMRAKARRPGLQPQLPRLSITLHTNTDNAPRALRWATVVRHCYATGHSGPAMCIAT